MFEQLLWAMWLECKYQNHIELCARASKHYPKTFPILPDDRATFGGRIFR